jgi:hypothetical protein
VTLLQSSARVDDIYEQTRVLLVPSVWPEAFGLVATEACARGIPCVSSTHGGLAEANVLARVPGFEQFAIPTPIFYDGVTRSMMHNTSLAAAEQHLISSGDVPAPLDFDTMTKEEMNRELRLLMVNLTTRATEEEVQPYIDLVSRLTTDHSFYAEASNAARSAGLDFIRLHRGSFRDIVEQLIKAHTQSLD